MFWLRRSQQQVITWGEVITELAESRIFARNVFDSCVKRLEYFRTDNMLLETSFYWLSEDIVRFKIEVGVEEKCKKNITPIPMDFPHTLKHAVQR